MICPRIIESIVVPVQVFHHYKVKYLDSYGIFSTCKFYVDDAEETDTSKIMMKCTPGLCSKRTTPAITLPAARDKRGDKPPSLQILVN